MFTLGALSFIAPWALLALLVLPALWWLLRIIPPAPRRLRFPAIRLIMRLVNPEESSAKTPLWLAVLRLALAAVIIGAAAHPVLNATTQAEGAGPLVLVVDDGWAAARNWNNRRTVMANLIDQAEREGRAVGIVTTAPQPAAGRIGISLMAPEDARDRARALEPKPWPVDRAAAKALLGELKTGGKAHVVWLSNGLDMGTARDFAAALARVGTVTVLGDLPGELPAVLLPPSADRQGLTLTARRAADVGDKLEIRARGEDGGILARRELDFKAGAKDGTLRLDLPVEIRNRLDVLEIEGQNTAGGVVLMDERWRRRPVGLASYGERRNDQPLLDDTYYLEKALDPFTEVRLGTIPELLKRELSLIVLVDPGHLEDTDRQALIRWMDGGGVTVRFAGPRLAGRSDSLLPVRLREGDRDLGGAMSWSRPAALAPFPDTSPFFGLTIPKDVRINRQVLAQPTVDLPKKTWARLTDGTPLVTADKRGKGWLVFFHTTANPQWSNLALSGLFVQMMQELVQLGRGVSVEGENRVLAPLRSINGFGRIVAPLPAAQSVSAASLAATKPGPAHPPGFYGDETSRRALNLSPSLPALVPIAGLGSGLSMQPYVESREQDLRPWLLTIALLLAIGDIVASMALRGLFGFSRQAAAGVAALIVVGWAAGAQAQGVQPPGGNGAPTYYDAALQVRLAYVKTGEATVDETSLAGLRGLSFIARSRTAAELADPVAVDPATDELAFFPLIYWPVTENAQTIPVDTAARINAYLRRGGTILFDTRDQGGGTYNGDRLQIMARHLDIPPLTQMPSDHVLTKAYYLLRDFPGRWVGGRVWVERAGVRTNDGVSSVIVGSNDWAAAWAVDQANKPLYQVVPGGERQREMAYRFGINLLMYALTGNYKADQVHLPAILERLGQ